MTTAPTPKALITEEFFVFNASDHAKKLRSLRITHPSIQRVINELDRQIIRHGHDTTLTVYGSTHVGKSVFAKHIGKAENDD